MATIDLSMRKLLPILALLAISKPSFAQTQGVSMRSTNGIGYGNTVIHNLIGEIGSGNVTNAAGSRVAYLSDATLPSNVATNNGNNQFSAAQTVNGAFTATGAVIGAGFATSGSGIVTSTSSGNASLFSAIQLQNSSSAFSWNSSGGFIHGPSLGMISLLDQNQIGGALILLGGGRSSVTLATTTNWPAIKPVTNDYPEIRFVLGTNVSAFSSIKADQVTSTNRVTGNTAWMTNGAINATTFFSLPTNYVAANFIPVAGRVNIVSSNGALFSVTQLSTNLISGP